MRGSRAFGKRDDTGIGTSLFLLAVGAILTYAVGVANPSGINIHTVGIILMVIGALGILISLTFWNSWGGFHRRGPYT